MGLIISEKDKRALDSMSIDVNDIYANAETEKQQSYWLYSKLKLVSTSKKFNKQNEMTR